MKKSTRIASFALAGMMVASTAAVSSMSVSAAKVKKPTKVKAVNQSKGIKITWKKVKGAKKYKVYRGKKKITTTKKKTYTDKKAKAGKTYKYTVKAVKGKKTSKKSKAVKIVRLKAPTGLYAQNHDQYVKLEWNKATGAKKYYVYRGTKKVATVSGLSYTDNSVKSGTKYTYKVKAVNGKSTSVASKAKSITFITAPTNFVAKVEGDKAVLTWDKVTGAAKYQILTQNCGDPMTVPETAVTDTTCTVLLGVNPDLIQFYVYAIAKDGSASKTIVTTAAYIPEGSYFTDNNGDLHVKINLSKAGDVFESYYAGKVLTSTFTADDYAITVDEESAKFVEVKDGVITGKASGTATVKVELKNETIQKKLYDKVCEATGKTFGNHLTTGVVYVDVTVA